MRKSVGNLVTIVATALLAVYAHTAASQEKVLYNFGGTKMDGKSPLSGLTSDAKGNFYGTAVGGGANGDGIVFELSPATGGGWTESILYTFGATSVDGQQPFAGLTLDAKGNLYGTTYEGGANSKGTVFELTPGAGGTWAKKTLYSFGATSTDGTAPRANLIFDSKGNLYGTTSQGGSANDQGTAFELSPSSGGTWTETVLWNFGSVSGDGAYPYAGMIFDTKGNLYGTTEDGGANGIGSVFELKPAGGGGWTESILYSFGSYSTDGVQPEADLVMDSQGNLYGTTANGGVKSAGTAFELTPVSGASWDYQQLYSFHAFTGDSQNPYAGLTFDAAGNLYGTAQAGGVSTFGTVYELSPTGSGTWTEKILYSFGAISNDGQRPISRMLFDAAGNLFGTTSRGGSGDYYGYGGGTVFEIPTTTTAVPDFSLAGGAYTTPQTLKITDPTPGAAVYYTTDGSTPTTASTKYTEAIDVAESETINAIAVATGLTQSGVATANYVIGETADKMTFSPAPGTYASPQSVALADTTPGAVIHYTTNGTTPTASSPKYTAPIPVSATTTIDAIAIAPGYLNSAVVSATYTITPPTATPVFSPVAGTYTAAQSVKITDATAGAVIYYTINGTKPTASSTKYTGPIAVNATETIEALAIAPTHASSAVATATYTIEKPAATPTFSPAAGTYTAAQTVTIKDATAGATIYYTVNGTAPTTASTKYTGPITVASSETIRAIAKGATTLASAVATADYVIEKPAATPTFSVAAGTYTAAQTVTIKDATAGVTIYYTTNGSTPTTASAILTGPITVSGSETISALAKGTTTLKSSVAMASYVIEKPAATPTFSLAAGTYSGAQTVAIKDATAGVTIYYTTNGTTPTTSSTQYTGPITISATETISALAKGTTTLKSAVATASYTIK